MTALENISLMNEVRQGIARPSSALEKGEPNVTAGVVDVEVDQADALPGAECQPPVQHGHGGVRRNQGGHDVRAAMAGASMPMLPAMVGR